MKKLFYLKRFNSHRHVKMTPWSLPDRFLVRETWLDKERTRLLKSSMGKAEEAPFGDGQIVWGDESRAKTDARRKTEESEWDGLWWERQNTEIERKQSQVRGECGRLLTMLSKKQPEEPLLLIRGRAATSLFMDGAGEEQRFAFINGGERTVLHAALGKHNRAATSPSTPDSCRK